MCSLKSKQISFAFLLSAKLRVLNIQGQSSKTRETFLSPYITPSGKLCLILSGQKKINEIFFFKLFTDIIGKIFYEDCIKNASLILKFDF